MVGLMYAISASEHAIAWTWSRFKELLLERGENLPVEIQSFDVTVGDASQ